MAARSEREIAPVLLRSKVLNVERSGLRRLGGSDEMFFSGCPTLPFRDGGIAVTVEDVLLLLEDAGANCGVKFRGVVSEDVDTGGGGGVDVFWSLDGEVKCDLVGEVVGVLALDVEGDVGVDGRSWFAGLSGRRNGDVRGGPIERGEGLYVVGRD